MYKDVYYVDPVTGAVTLHSMYEISANESLAKWPDQYFTKLPKKMSDAKVQDLRPPTPSLADLRGDESAKGPPVVDRA